MQKIPLQGNRPARALHLRRSPVHRVPHHRVSQRRQVHPDLVRPPRIDLHLEQRELPKPRFHPSHDPVMRDRFPPARSPRRHAHPPHAVPADALADRPPLRLHPSVHQRHIRLLYLALGELRCQLAVRLVVLRHHHQPAGLFVQPMHDPRPQLSPTPDSAPNRCSSAFTSVPRFRASSVAPAPACTIIPARLSITARSSSSYTMSRGMSSAIARSGSTAAGPCTLMSSPPRSRSDALAAFPSTCTSPCAINCCTRARLTSAIFAARYWSRRAPASSALTENVSGDFWDIPLERNSTVWPGLQT